MSNIAIAEQTNKRLQGTLIHIEEAPGTNPINGVVHYAYIAPHHTTGIPDGTLLKVLLPTSKDSSVKTQSNINIANRAISRNMNKKATVENYMQSASVLLNEASGKSGHMVYAKDSKVVLTNRQGEQQTISAANAITGPQTQDGDIKITNFEANWIIAQEAMAHLVENVTGAPPKLLHDKDYNQSSMYQAINQIIKQNGPIIQVGIDGFLLADGREGVHPATMQGLAIRDANGDFVQANGGQFLTANVIAGVAGNMTITNDPMSLILQAKSKENDGTIEFTDGSVANNHLKDQIFQQVQVKTRYHIQSLGTENARWESEKGDRTARSQWNNFAKEFQAIDINPVVIMSAGETKTLESNIERRAEQDELNQQKKVNPELPETLDRPNNFLEELGRFIQATESIELNHAEKDNANPIREGLLLELGGVTKKEGEESRLHMAFGAGVLFERNEGNPNPLPLQIKEQIEQILNLTHPSMSNYIGDEVREVFSKPNDTGKKIDIYKIPDQSNHGKMVNKFYDLVSNNKGALYAGLETWLTDPVNQNKNGYGKLQALSQKIQENKENEEHKGSNLGLYKEIITYMKNDTSLFSDIIGHLHSKNEINRSMENLTMAATNMEKEYLGSLALYQSIKQAANEHLQELEKEEYLKAEKEAIEKLVAEETEKKAKIAVEKEAEAKKKVEAKEADQTEVEKTKETAPPTPPVYHLSQKMKNEIAQKVAQKVQDFKEAGVISLGAKGDENVLTIKVPKSFFGIDSFQEFNGYAKASQQTYTFEKIDENAQYEPQEQQRFRKYNEMIQKNGWEGQKITTHSASIKHLSAVGMSIASVVYAMHDKDKVTKEQRQTTSPLNNPVFLVTPVKTLASSNVKELNRIVNNPGIEDLSVEFQKLEDKHPEFQGIGANLLPDGQGNKVSKTVRNYTSVNEMDNIKTEVNQALQFSDRRNNSRNQAAVNILHTAKDGTITAVDIKKVSDSEIFTSYNSYNEKLLTLAKILDERQKKGKAVPSVLKDRDLYEFGASKTDLNKMTQNRGTSTPSWDNTIVQKVGNSLKLTKSDSIPQMTSGSKGVVFAKEDVEQVYLVAKDNKIIPQYYAQDGARNRLTHNSYLINHFEKVVDTMSNSPVIQQISTPAIIVEHAGYGGFVGQLTAQAAIALYFDDENKGIEGSNGKWKRQINRQEKVLPDPTAPNIPKFNAASVPDSTPTVIINQQPINTNTNINAVFNNLFDGNDRSTPANSQSLQQPQQASQSSLEKRQDSPGLGF